MLYTKAQSELAEATAEMMRTCAVTSARVAGTSFFQGLLFWSRLMRPSTARHDPELTAPAAPWPACTPQSADDAVATPEASAAPDSAFSSYRSSSGHAVAQVIVQETAP